MKRTILLLNIATTFALANSIHFQINTAPLAGMTSPPELVLDLFDGDGTENQNVSIHDILFGGGTPVGTPILGAGATGDIASGFALRDLAFLVEAGQTFSAGNHIALTIDFLPAFAGGTPDSFTITLLNGNGQTIPTSDPLGTDTLLAVDLGDGTWQAFNSPLLGTPVVNDTPEPAALAIPGLVLIVLGACRKRHHGWQR